MKSTTIAVDVAKPVFEVAISHHPGRARERRRLSRTGFARINTVRGLLREMGIVVPVGACHVIPQLRSLIDEAESPVPHALHESLHGIAGEIRHLARGPRGGYPPLLLQPSLRQLSRPHPS